MNQSFATPALAAIALCTAGHAGLYIGTGGSVPNDSPAGRVFTIDVADSLVIADLSVTLTNFRHAHLGDLAVTLTHVPTGTALSLFDRVGRTTTAGSNKGDSSDLHYDYTFADGGANLWAAANTANGSGKIAGGTFEATGSGIGSTVQTGPSGLSFTGAFAGIDARGVWQLHISDHAGGHSLNNDWGWSLAFTAVPGPGAMALAAVAGMACGLGRRRR